MSVNNLSTFLNIKDSHLRVVSGNVYAQGINIGGITVDVAHGLQSITNQGNVTTNTLQFDNATTAFTTTANATVGRDLTVTGNATVSSNLTVTGNVTVSSNLTVTGNAVVSDDLTVTGNTFYTNPTAVLVDSNVVTEYTGPHDRPLRKYPEVAMTSASQGGYIVTPSTQNGVSVAAYYMFDGDRSTRWRPNATNDTYDISSPFLYNGSRSSRITDTSETQHDGVFLKLELPKAIKLDYTVIRENSFPVGGTPGKITFLGSTNGTDWTFLKEFSGMSSTALDETYAINETNYYNHFAFVVKNLSDASGELTLGEWELYGHEEGSGSLDTTLKSVYNVPATTGTQLEVYYDGQDYTEVPGSVADKTGNGHNGTIVGNGVGFDSTYKAFTFAGSDDYFHSTLDWSGDQVHSVSFWVKTTRENVPQTAVLLGTAAASGWQNHFSAFELMAGGNIKWYFGSNDIQYYADWTPNTWIHLAFSYIGGGSNSHFKSAYMNGRKLDVKVEPTTSTAVSFNSGDTVIRVGGGYFDTIEDDFIGSIANLRIYEKALNADQVKELYDYQKDYFLGSKSQVTLYKGHLGVGVTEPSGQLELAGDERIQEYPPRGMTDFDTYIEGHGVFTASASSVFSSGEIRQAYQAFNGGTDIVNDDAWISKNDRYTSGLPNANAALINGVAGEWLGIQFPYPIKLKQIAIQNRAGGNNNRSPDSGILWGSNDGTEYEQVVSWSGLSFVTNGSTPSYVTINATNTYRFFRLQGTKVVDANSSDFLAIGELKFFGTPGPTTLDKGSLTLGRSLDVPRISRYDVDTETPRPEKLVVDFDTTVNSSPTDISGQGNHGTFYNGAFYSPADKAFSFDGTDDYVSGTLNNPSGNWTHSVSLWMYPTNFDATNEWLYWIGTENTATGTGLQFTSTQIKSTVRNGSSHAVDHGLSGPAWVHVVVVYYSQERFKIYLDGGARYGTETIDTDLLNLPENTTLYVGGRHTGLLYFTGQVSNFKVYNVALEPSEVRKLYNLGRTGRSMVISDTAVGIGKVPEAQLDVRGVANFERVGIGVDNPGKTLDVNGTIRSRKNAGWKSGTFNSTGVNMGPLADGTTDGAQIGWEFHVTFSAATAGSRVEIYGAYKHSGPLYAASEKWTFRFKEGVGTPDFSNYAELVNDAEPLADTYYAVIRVVNSIYNNTDVVAARHHFMSHSVGCLRGIGATIWQAQGYIDMGGESVDDRFNYLRLTSSSGNIKGQWTVFPITT